MSFKIGQKIWRKGFVGPSRSSTVAKPVSGEVVGISSSYEDRMDLVDVDLEGEEDTYCDEEQRHYAGSELEARQDFEQELSAAVKSTKKELRKLKRAQRRNKAKLYKLEDKAK